MSINDDKCLAIRDQGKLLIGACQIILSESMSTLQFDKDILMQRDWILRDIELQIDGDSPVTVYPQDLVMLSDLGTSTSGVAHSLNSTFFKNNWLLIDSIQPLELLGERTGLGVAYRTNRLDIQFHFQFGSKFPSTVLRSGLKAFIKAETAET